MSKIKSKIRIIAAPPGEAPLWVREKWIGLELPLTGGASPRKYLTLGALSGPHTFLLQLWAAIRGRVDHIVGFPVETVKAIDILEISSPEAAAWWRENTPELIRPRRFLIFHAEVCHVVAE